MKIYPEKLAMILREKGISQKNLANMLGVTETTISRYMSGKYKPTKSVVINIAEKLNIRITDFAEMPEIKKPFKEKNNKYNQDKTLVQNEIDTLKQTTQDKLIDETLSFWKDDDLRIIQRARANMSYEDKKKMMDILSAVFSEVFSNIED